MSAVDDFLSATAAPSSLDVGAVVGQLARNRDFKTLIMSLNKYSKADWANLMLLFSRVYTVFQSSLFVSSGDCLQRELKKYPWLCQFFERVSNEC